MLKKPHQSGVACVRGVLGRERGMGARVGGRGFASLEGDDDNVRRGMPASSRGGTIAGKRQPFQLIYAGARPACALARSGATPASMTSTTKALRASLVGAVAVMALACSAHAADKEKEPFGSLSVDEVQKLVDAKGADIFDNNSQERWQEGHVPGAKWVNPHELKAEALPKDKARKLVFYCANEH